MVKGLHSLVGKNRLIVRWETSFDLASLGIGLSSTMRVSLATDETVRRCLLRHAGLDGSNRSIHLEEFPYVSIPISWSMGVLFGKGNGEARDRLGGQERDFLRDAFFNSTLSQHLGRTMLLRWQQLDHPAPYLRGTCAGWKLCYDPSYTHPPPYI